LEKYICLELPLTSLLRESAACMTLQSLYDKVTPAFDAMGKKSFYLDDVGGGAKMKLVVNMIMGRYFNYTPSFPAVKMFHGTLCGDTVMLFSILVLKCKTS
jgi:hypothetical protein